MTKKTKPSAKVPKIKQIEITLEIETGNLIHRKFDNKEDLLSFIHEYAKNPIKIREVISPKKRTKNLKLLKKQVA